MVAKTAQGLDASDWEAVHQLIATVINDSEDAVVYVRSLGIMGTVSRAGRSLMEDESDIRLEPRQRVVRSLDITAEDRELFERGRTATVKLTSGQMARTTGALSGEIAEFVKQINTTGTIRTRHV
jgi:hypothetical protein